jgi:hypothetical protein
MSDSNRDELHMKVDDERQVVVFSLGDSIAEWSFQEARLKALWLIEATSLAGMYMRAQMEIDPNAPRPIHRGLGRTFYQT